MDEKMHITSRLRFLGPFAIEQTGCSSWDVGGRKALALLAYLVRSEQPQAREHLATMLWSDKGSARGRRNLSRELSRLVARLPGCFRADYYTVQWSPPPAVWVDVCAFQSPRGVPCAQGSNTWDDPSDAWFAQHATSDVDAAKLAQLVACYRGEFMAGLYLDGCAEFETWLVREREWWRQQVTEALEQLIAHHALRHEDDRATSLARRWLLLEPWQEEAHRYLLVLLARNGRRSAALRQYDICRQMLADELGVTPDTETIALVEQIRSGALSRYRAAQPVSHASRAFQA